MFKPYKKFLSSLFIFTVIVTILSSRTFAFASTSSSKAEVLGTVKQCSNLLPYVQVTATCGTQTLTGSTGSSGGDMGKYSLTFQNSQCVNGSNANVTAKVDGNSFSNSGTIGTYFFFWDKAWVDVQTGSDCGNGDPSVPEFGAITGVLAAVGSAGSYLLLKKRSA